MIIKIIYSNWTVPYQTLQTARQEPSDVPVSVQLDLFRDPLDGLKAHQPLEHTEVLAGTKPASLISLVNRSRSCGRNPYQRCHQPGERVLSRFKALQIMQLYTKGTAVLQLRYNTSSLDRHLNHSGIRTLLQKERYTFKHCTDMLFIERRQQITTRDSFPLEIGLFIGSPAKDVAAFTGVIRLPYTCQGPWKIYDNPSQSLSLADSYRQIRKCMGSKLISCSSIEPCLEQLNRNNKFF